MVTQAMINCVGDQTDVQVQLPETLDEVRAVLDSLPANEEIDMWDGETCLGARMIAFYNPGAADIGFGHITFDLRVDGQLFRNVRLTGAAHDFFYWLFRESGIREHATEFTTSTVHHEARVCPCGDPECDGSYDAYDEEETEDRVTARSLREALDVFAALPPVPTPVASAI